MAAGGLSWDSVRETKCGAPYAERQHREMAEAAESEQVRRVHIALAEAYAQLAKATAS